MAEEEAFEARLKQKEEEHMGRLVEEWEQREREREQLLSQKVCTCLCCGWCVCVCVCVCVLADMVMDLRN